MLRECSSDAFWSTCLFGYQECLSSALKKDRHDWQNVPSFHTQLWSLFVKYVFIQYFILNTGT